MDGGLNLREKITFHCHSFLGVWTPWRELDPNPVRERPVPIPREFTAAPCRRAAAEILILGNLGPSKSFHVTQDKVRRPPQMLSLGLKAPTCMISGSMSQHAPCCPLHHQPQAEVSACLSSPALANHHSSVWVWVFYF